MDEQEKQDNSEQTDAGEKTSNASSEDATEGESSVEAVAVEETSSTVEAEQELPVAETESVDDAEPVTEEVAEPEEQFPDAPNISGLIGRKVGMTTYYTDDGRALPVTAIEVGPCVVVQVKTEARNGYQAVQIGFLTAKSLTKPLAGHMERSGGRFRHLQEFIVKDLSEFEVGQKIHANLFEAGAKVKVSGVSKGHGFSVGVRRHGFAGGPKTHGQSDRHRAPGSIGAGSSPGRVWPGTKMAGHYGSVNVTQKGLRIVLADPQRNLILVGGAVPGHKNSIVRIEKQA